MIDDVRPVSTTTFIAHITTRKALAWIGIALTIVLGAAYLYRKGPSLLGRTTKGEPKPPGPQFQELRSLEQKNEELKQQILDQLPQIKLPEPVENRDILMDILDWPHNDMEAVIAGTKQVSPLHLQAAQYIHASNSSQQTMQNEIIPFVYVGNYDALRSLDPSQKSPNPIPFKRVISVTNQDASREFFKANIPASIERVSVPVNDEDQAWGSLESRFDEIFLMIDQARQSEEPILIHCSQGQSRSVTVMLAYLINRLNLNFDDAFKFVRSKRFLAEPIPGLQARLRQYYNTCKRD